MSVVTQHVKLNHAGFFSLPPLPFSPSLAYVGGEPFVVEAEGEVIEALVEDGDFIATSLVEVDQKLGHGPEEDSDVDNPRQVRPSRMN